MIKEVCYGYSNIMAKEAIAQAIYEVLKENDKPMKCTDITEALWEKYGDDMGISVQKASSVLKKMCYVGGYVTRKEICLDETIEIELGKCRCCKHDRGTKTVHKKEILFEIIK